MTVSALLLVLLCAAPSPATPASGPEAGESKRTPKKGSRKKSAVVVPAPAVDPPVITLPAAPAAQGGAEASMTAESAPAASTEAVSTEAISSEAPSAFVLPPIQVGGSLGIALSLSGSVSAAPKLTVFGSAELGHFKKLRLRALLPVSLLTTGSSVTILDFTISTSLVGLDVVPSGRGVYPINEDLEVYVDAGLGMAFYVLSLSTTFQGTQRTFLNTGLFRVASGAQYKLTDRARVYFEPIGANLYFSSTGTGALWSVNLGGAYDF